jgi:hypothetical protein
MGWRAEELRKLTNPADIARLVVFDTWTRNCDRHCSTRENMDNVFIATDGGFHLVAIDHGHCFTCGSALTAAVGHLDRIREERVYGLFPAFRPFVTRERIEDLCAVLSGFEAARATAVVESVPTAWDLSAEARTGLVEFIVQRSQFVAERLPGWLEPTCWPQA